ncbi:MAG: DsrE family protein [Thiotrichales bacterium]|nr:DsrE family protein [Thiotrichales bacterium]
MPALITLLLTPTTAITRWLLAPLLLIGLSPLALAAQTEAPLPDTFAQHKVVLQISDADPEKQILVLNVAANLQRYYDAANVDIEVVAFGPGVRLMLKDNAHSKRIQSLIAGGVRFSACENTLQNFAKILGEKPQIIEGIDRVPTGAGRILQLNAAGWQLLKP